MRQGRILLKLFTYLEKEHLLGHPFVKQCNKSSVFITSIPLFGCVSLLTVVTSPVHQNQFFRESYPTICKDSNTKDSLDNKTEWLTERCKHDKFRNRNTKLCSSLEIGETLPSDVSIDDTVTKEETFNTSAEVADKEGDVDDETTISSTDSPSTESSTSFEELTTVNNMSLVAQKTFIEAIYFLYDH